jgi:putative transposase
LPLLYLRGLSTGDFRPALEGLWGAAAGGLSPTNIARLTAYGSPGAMRSA